MRSIKMIVCLALVVITMGFAVPAMALRSDSVSTAYFDAAGNFVGQSLYTCNNTHFDGGAVTQYSVVQFYPCYPGTSGGGDPGIQPASVTSTLPPGFTQAQACAVLATYGDNCGNPPYYLPPVYGFNQ
jgi:hypothetical protein